MIKMEKIARYVPPFLCLGGMGYLLYKSLRPPRRFEGGLHADDLYIKDKTGAVVRLMGVYYSGRYLSILTTRRIEESEIRNISRFGFNAIRLNVSFEAWEAWGDTARGELRRVLEFCNKHRLYVVIQFFQYGLTSYFVATHEGFPARFFIGTDYTTAGEAEHDFLYNTHPNYDIWYETSLFLKDLASIGKNYKCVAGYWLYNEPLATSLEDCEMVVKRHEYWGRSAVREIDQNKIIFYSRPQGRDVNTFCPYPRLANIDNSVLVYPFTESLEYVDGVPHPEGMRQKQVEEWRVPIMNGEGQWSLQSYRDYAMNKMEEWDWSWIVLTCPGLIKGTPNEVCLEYASYAKRGS